MTKHIIDIENWERKEYYNFFGMMDNPFLGVTAKADFYQCYIQAKEDGESFMLYSLHKILRAVNAIPEFRYRIEDENVVIYDTISASSTIGRENGSFGFGYFNYYEDRKDFVSEAKKEVKRIKESSGLCLGKEEARMDLIYYSPLPWIDFTDISHAGNLAKGQSIPRITTGKLTETGNKLEMSVSVELNHGLADGYHVAQFFRLLNEM